MNRAAAEIIALQALAFLAGDPERLGVFLAATGLGPQDLRQGARDPALLAGVLDHLLGDETTLLEFCAVADVAAGAPARARALLPGGEPPRE